MPIFNYCCSVFCSLNLENSNKLQRSHNACIRFITNCGFRDHISPLRENLGYLTLDKTRKLHTLNLLFKILKTDTPEYLKSKFIYSNTQYQHNLRNYHKLNIPLSRTNYYHDSFSVNAARLWNSLPLNIIEKPSVSTFSSELKKHLSSNNI